MTRRGTSNSNERGSTTDRRRRREWLVATYRADLDIVGTINGLTVTTDQGHGTPACRCYRCGDLLTIDTVTADRITPGCEGGTYHRANLRPACAHCNSSAGGKLGQTRRRVTRAAP